MAKPISVSLPDELVEELNDHLEYGDNRSAWVADAIREKLDRELEEDAEGNPKRATPMAD
jgi:metal-responsive CopG/Arc/MetJ family transcriptional regulator